MQRHVLLDRQCKADQHNTRSTAQPTFVDVKPDGSLDVKPDGSLTSVVNIKVEAGTGQDDEAAAPDGEAMEDTSMKVKVAT